MNDVMGDVANRTSAALSLYPKGTIDAAWGSWDELAKGGLQAILENKRTEIKVITVDVSDVDLNLMRENPDVFLAAVGCDQSLPGVAAMRLLAYKLAGLETPDTYEVPVALIRVEDLKPDTTIATLGDVVDGWGVISDFIAPWMGELEALNK
jgi:simple sugar transport system substrate-binding protein